MKPYFEEDGITIYHGDAREFSSLPGESVITDPVWPNSAFPDIEDPQMLLTQVLSKCSRETRRIVIHLGCNTAAACQSLGVRFVGIEREEHYCEIAAKRLSQSVLPFDPERAA